MSPLLARPYLTGGHIAVRGMLLAVAILLASAPLSGLLAGWSWFLLTAAGALPVLIAGIVLRRLLRSAPLVPLLQAVVIILVMLLIQLSQNLVSLDAGPLGIIRAQGEIFPAAVNDLASGLAPMVLGARSTALVILLIALITLALDLMFTDLGWHTPTGLFLMSSLLVPALQHPSGGPWWTVAGPVLAGLLIFSTRTVHADPSTVEGDSRPQAGPLPAPGRTSAATVIACLLVATLTVPIGQVLPQLSPSRVALNIDLINQWQNRDMPQLGPVMIDDEVSVRRSLLEQEETEVLRYTTTDPDPSYLRLRTLTSFDGESYQAPANTGEDPADQLPTSFSDARTDGMAVSGSAEELIEHDVTLTNLGGNRLPVPQNLRSLQASSEEVDERATALATNGEVSLGRGGANITGLTYQLQSETSPAAADGLRRVDPAVFDEPFETGYTSGDRIPEVIADLASQTADDAGADTAFDTAIAFQNYFHNSFAYSLTVRTPPGQDPVESFLQDRIGYCEQFAAAFALMMTAQGYPTRVAIGFTAGQLDGDEWSVTSRNAHAWPEVWFGPQYGWVPFEPTPAAAANGVREPSVTDEAPADEDLDEPAAEQTTATEDDPTDETSEEDSTEEDPEDTADQEEDSTGTELLDEQGEPTAGFQSGVLALLAVGTALAVAGLVIVAVIRGRRLQAREERWAALVAGMAPGGDDPVTTELVRRRAGELAWRELQSELVVRDRTITWLGWTGGWGRPPRELTLDPALPPARAIDALLDDIDAGTVEVGEQDRAAAARIAAAYTAATYAAPLPQDAVDVIDAGRGGSGSRADAAAGRDAATVGGDAATVGRDGVSSGAGAAPSTPEPSAVQSPQRASQPALRADTDRLIALIRAAR